MSYRIVLMVSLPSVSNNHLTPFQAKSLQKSLQDKNLPEKFRQRIEIMLLADQGKTQAQICREIGCSRSTARYWSAMARAGNAHQWNATAIGRPKTVNDDYLQLLKELMSQSPKDFGYKFEQWKARSLSRYLEKELGIKITPRHINRLLKDMGLSTRPKPAPVEDTASEGVNRVLIGDLTETSVSKSPVFWPLNSLH